MKKIKPKKMKNGRTHPQSAKRASENSGWNKKTKAGVTHPWKAQGGTSKQHAEERNKGFIVVNFNSTMGVSK